MFKTPSSSFIYDTPTRTTSPVSTVPLEPPSDPKLLKELGQHLKTYHSLKQRLHSLRYRKTKGTRRGDVLYTWTEASNNVHKIKSIINHVKRNWSLTAPVARAELRECTAYESEANRILEVLESAASKAPKPVPSFSDLIVAGISRLIHK